MRLAGAADCSVGAIRAQRFSRLLSRPIPVPWKCANDFSVSTFSYSSEQPDGTANLTCFSALSRHIEANLLAEIMQQESKH
jgi:hypothetical protein